MADDEFLSLLHQIAEIEGVEFEEIAERLDRIWGHERISDRMAPRYRRAIREYLNCSSLTDYLALPVDVRGDLRGIFTRVKKQDQWDWMHVQIGLGLRRDRCSLVSYTMLKLKNAESEEERQSLFSELQALELSDPLRSLLAHIERTQTGLPNPTKRRQQGGAQSEEHIRTSIDYAPIVQKIKAAGRLHRLTEDCLIGYLASCGFRCEQNVFVDVFCRLKGGPALFEIKSITTDNERSQTRRAISQLLEYRFLHKFEAPTLWIVFSSKPVDEVMCVNFPQSLGIRVLWMTNESIGGPDFFRVLTNPRAESVD